MSVTERKRDRERRASESALEMCTGGCHPRVGVVSILSVTLARRPAFRRVPVHPPAAEWRRSASGKLGGRGLCSHYGASLQAHHRAPNCARHVCNHSGYGHVTGHRSDSAVLGIFFGRAEPSKEGSGRFSPGHGVPS